MTVNLGEAVVGIRADTSGFTSGFGAVADKLTSLPAIALGATAAMAGLGAVAVKMAANFQQGLTSLVTGAGESQKNLKVVSDGILQMSVDTGTSTKQLIDGMFMIESAGWHGAQGLQVLKNAAMGAKVGNADLGVVADATTTIMKDFGISANNSAQAVNVLIATVSSGKTHMQDLASSLAQIAPTASAAHVSLNDMMGALATMTGEGVPAANAATYLRQAIMGIEKSTPGATKTLKDIGLSSAEVASEMQKSLPDALKMVTDALGKKFPETSQAYNVALATIAGGAKNMQAWLDLTGKHMQEFQSNVQNVGGAVKESGNTIKGWSDVQNDFNFKIDQARQIFETLAIKVGTALLPSLTALLNNTVIPLMNNFSQWMNQGGGLKDFQQWVQNVSIFLTSALIPAFSSLLNNNITPLAQGMVNMWTDAVDLFQAFQQGQGYAVALGVALASIGSAIGVIKLEEFGAGLANVLAQMSDSGGVIANMAANVLPELGKQLGWVTVQAEASSAAITTIGPASEAAEGVVAVSAAGMTLALGVATAGISLLIGGTIAAIALAAAQGKQTMSQSTKQVYSSLGQTAADTKAKVAVDAQEMNWNVSIAAQNGSANATSRWQNSYEQQAKSSADARAKMIADQQAIQDAAIKAAAAADAAWVKASQDANLAALLKTGGMNDKQVAQYTGQAQTNTSGTTLSSGQRIGAHASGGVIAPGTYGTAGEFGTELLYGGSSGISVLDAQRTAGLGGGGDIHLHIEVGGREVMTALFNQADSMVRARYGAGSRT